jgi:RHS repeat-associated protein
LDGRTVSVDGYRFGYQGSEKDNEFKGDGNSYTTEFRQLDPRLGRWLSVDPVIQPWQSSYCSMDCNPVSFRDQTGTVATDFVKRADGGIYWDKNAKSKSTTKKGETYLGKKLTFKFTSYIDKNLWDGPFCSFPTGTKVISIINVSANVDKDDNLTSINVKSDEPQILYKAGFIPTDDFYPGQKNQSVNKQMLTSGNQVTFEQHAKINEIEEIGLTIIGYDKVNVAQKLTIGLDFNTIRIKASTDIFPSASLRVNDHVLFRYNQPSFKSTHGVTKIIVDYRIPSNKLDDGLSPIYKFHHRRPDSAFYLRYQN